MIVSIGWGSLIWCPKALPVGGHWHTNGPDLSIEFARESRDGRITLVVCPGAPTCQTLWAQLIVRTMEEAKSTLAQREGIKLKNIKFSVGFWTPTGVSDHAESTAMGQWAHAHGFEGVVWTALKPRFGGAPCVPSAEDVIGHLRGLEGVKRQVAEEYIRLTPRQIATPYRTAIENALGWTPMGLI